MRFLSVCSGIEAATVASAHLGWQAAGYAEIDPFCSSLLKEKYPDVPNHGDFSKITAEQCGPVDAIVGGTPCQDFSVAGKRAGLDGARGNLTLEFVRLVERVRPRWVFWENVPGVLSIDGGRAFGAFLGALAQLGYGFAWRIFDAQYFGLAQERRRVFLCGYSGAWQPAASVLFESESVRGYPPPRREKGQEVAPTLNAGPVTGGRTYGTCADSVEGLIPQVAMCLNAGGCSRIDGESETFIVHTLRAEGFDASEDEAGRGTPILPALTSNGDAHSRYRDEHGLVVQDYEVRRITPCEGERLQGFEDDYTLITYRGKPAADGPRYKALGNSWAVPCVRWIFERMEAVDAALSAPR